MANVAGNKCEFPLKASKNITTLEANHYARIDASPEKCSSEVGGVP